MFQSYAFQCVAFQSVWGIGTPTPTPDTGGLPHKYTYIPKYQLDEIEQRKRIAQAKTEAQKLESVLKEYERRRALAEESIALANAKEQVRLLKLQNELISEINRLLMVKAEMMARIKREEEQLILMMVMQRRRFRAFNVDNKRKLSYV